MALLRPTSETSISGGRSIPVSSRMAAKMVAEFSSGGLTVHSSTASTAWVLIAGCAANGIPVLAYQQACDGIGGNVLLVRADRPFDANEVQPSARLIFDSSGKSEVLAPLPLFRSPESMGLS